MIDIKLLHVHWTDKDEKRHVKAIVPTDPTSTLMIKKDIAEYVQSIKEKIEYYYVVVEIDRGGKPGFRTIIPKTFPKV